MYQRIPIFSCRRKPGCPEKNLPRRVWNRQIKFTYNHWLAALVEGKCSNTKPTILATGVVCHPDKKQNKPYKIPWPCQELKRGPTAPQARTLPVCHTTHYYIYKKRKSLFLQFHLIPIPCSQIMHDYVCFSALYCVNLLTSAICEICFQITLI